MKIKSDKPSIKIWLLCSMMWIWISFFGIVNWAWSCNSLSSDPYSCLTKDTKNVISEDIAWSNDPLIKWAQEIANQTNIYKWWIEWWANRKAIDAAIMSRIQSVLNYAISFLATVALIYLLVNWFTLLVNNDDDTQKKALSKIKTAFWAIWWIWLSRFIVSAMFWIIKQFVK
jgi:hypothetical protein